MKARMGVVRDEGGSAMAVRCERCRAEFDARERLVTHVRDDKHGAIPGGGLICNACGMAFSS
jgi:hypothetical protein